MKQYEQTVVVRAGTTPCPDVQLMEFHINAALRKECNFDETLFSSSGNVIFANQKAVHLFVLKYNKTVNGRQHPEQYLKAGQLNAMGLIDEIFHYVCRLYRTTENKTFFEGAVRSIETKIGTEAFAALIQTFIHEFPPRAVYKKEMSESEWLAGSDTDGTANRIIALEEMMMLILANENPAFEPFFRLFSDTVLKKNPSYAIAWKELKMWSAKNPPFGPEGLDLVSMLKAPVEYSPYDLKGQLEYIRTKWFSILGEWLSRLLSGLDLIAEEQKAGWSGGIGSGTPDMDPYTFGDISKEYERFSPDREWMPNVVLIAKSALVWLSQLTEKYQRPITRLDQIPDEELDFLAASGFTGLWLIGLWERSPASKRIKQICGNPEAAASAYSLDDYDIAGELGGWEALDNLRSRAWKRGVRLASDMVPNHTGMDAKWVVEKPDLFIQTNECPYPGYDFNGENLSHDSRVGIYLENHYYNKTDCAVVFKRVDHATGDTRYIYHGNDGTGMPWNDTAQIDFLNPQAREEVIQKILHVAKNFPIIRFDAAMVLAKKHIQRLWYPEPGSGGDIASRSRFAISREEFERRIPEEFWREVVDRCAKEIPDTLLLAEAFWMMEGYFVRTLGMHRVYNSAFMNMLKREDNQKYRSTIKNTIEFDPEILKRYVNFMNNPDEETAVVQFGKDDKYFGVCTMMVAMPGLPMFGHGQVEGFEEKYGMEYRKAYRNEVPDGHLLYRHQREIFPLMKKRYLFAGVDNFCLYDFYENGSVNENVFVWSNRVGQERALIFYNNVYQHATGWIKVSAASAVKQSDGSRVLEQRTLAQGLGLENRDNRFTIMQEQRSGLWYIRTNREIIDKGMFASLNGFQTQVFLNIYEVDDNEWGHYRTLYNSLDGRGIYDVHMGIQNIFLKDLYASLSAFASPAFFSSVHNIYAMKEQNIEACIAGMEPAARAFFAKLEEFLKGPYGAAPVLGTNADATANKTAGKGKKKQEDGSEFTAVDADALWTSFSLRVEKLLNLPLAAVSRINDLVPETVKLINKQIETFYAPEGMPEAMAGAVILYSVKDCIPGTDKGRKTRGILDLWSLDRKMTEILADYGLNQQAVTRLYDMLKACLCVADMPPVNEKDLARAILEKLFTDSKTGAFLGIHEWDSIVWFNKDAADHLLFILGAALSVIGVPLKVKVQKAVAGTSGKSDSSGRSGRFSWSGWADELLLIARTQRMAEQLFEKAGYRVQPLIGLLAPVVKKPAAKKAADKKPAVNKPAAKKPAAKKPTSKETDSGNSGDTSGK